MPTSTPTDPYTRDPAILFARRLASDARALVGAKARFVEALRELPTNSESAYARLAINIERSTGKDLERLVCDARRSLKTRRDALASSPDIQAQTHYTSALRLVGELFGVL